MEAIQAITLGIIQGLTEFFPISSSGHLIIIPKIFNWKGIVGTLSFDVALHLGTALALIIFFWKDWVKLVSNFITQLFSNRQNLTSEKYSRLFIYIIIASIPAAIAGVLLKPIIEASFRSVFLIGVNLIGFGILLWFFDKKGKVDKNMDRLKVTDAIFIGIAQAMALVPGVSRSGVTITTARLLNIDRETAVRFSFLLSTPVIIGAGVYTMKDVISDGIVNLQIFTIGFIAAAISGIIAIKFLIYISKTRDFTFFVVYRLVLGGILVLFSLLLKI